MAEVEGKVLYISKGIVPPLIGHIFVAIVRANDLIWQPFVSAAPFGQISKVSYYSISLTN